MGFAAKLASKTQPHSWFLSKKQNASIDLGGQVFGVYDDLYKQKPIADIPSPVTDTAAFTARDQARRLARRANGRDSTIRTSPAGATLYSAQPKALLGS